MGQVFQNMDHLGAKSWYIYIYTQKSTFKTTKQAFLTLLYIADHNITSDLRPQDGYGILISGSAAATLEENVLETWPVI